MKQQRYLQQGSLVLSVLFSSMMFVSGAAYAESAQGCDVNPHEPNCESEPAAHRDGHEGGADHDKHDETGDGHEGHDEGSDDHEGHDNHEDHDEEGVRLTDAVLKEFGVEVATAEAGTIVRSVVLPAEIRANEDRVAHIAPRFPGIVKEVRKSVGDVVAQGDTLAVVESNESLAPYALKSELSGVVIARHITRGEPVTRETQAFIVADLSEVWVDISVYQKDLARVQPGQDVEISAGHGREQARGVLSYVAPVLDEVTRTAIARVVLLNPSRRWRPGMFVTAAIAVEQVDARVVIPRGAIQVVEGRKVVFVEVDGAYEPRQVEAGATDERMVEIVSGLSVGDRYAASGAFTLKSELARDELSGGHSH